MQVREEMDLTNDNPWFLIWIDYVTEPPEDLSINCSDSRGGIRSSKLVIQIGHPIGMATQDKPPL